MQKQILELQDKVDKKTAATGGSRVPLTKSKTVPAELRKDAPMTSQDKEKIKNLIGSLLQPQQSGIIKIVQDYCTKNISTGVFEFELDLLPPEKLRELEAYVEKC